MKLYLISTLCLILSVSMVADRVKIKRVLDSNLFETNAGQQIRLVNIEAPSISEPNPQTRALAFKIKRYAEDQFLHQSLDVEYIKSHDTPAGVQFMLMWKQYPLRRVDFNQRYLEQGYGKLVHHSIAPIPQKYLDAEQMAKSKKRGVWNQYWYTPPPPKRYAVRMLYGSGSYEKSEGTYHEALLSVHPFGPRRGSGVRFAILYGRYTQEYAAPQTGVTYYSANPYWFINGKYLGLEQGLLISRFPHSEGIKFIMLPSVRLKAGILNQAYVSLDFLTDMLYSLFSYGINLQYPHFKMWIGATPRLIADRQIIAIKTEYLIGKRVLLNLHGARYRNRYEAEDVFGWRFGFGYIFQ